MLTARSRGSHLGGVLATCTYRSRSLRRGTEALCRASHEERPCPELPAPAPSPRQPRPGGHRAQRRAERKQKRSDSLWQPTAHSPGAPPPAPPNSGVDPPPQPSACTTRAHPLPWDSPLRNVPLASTGDPQQNKEKTFLHFFKIKKGNIKLLTLPYLKQQNKFLPKEMDFLSRIIFTY